MKRSKWSCARWSYLNCKCSYFTETVVSSVFFPYVQAPSVCSLQINREEEYVLIFFCFCLDWQRMSFLTSNSFWPPITSSKGSSRWRAMTKADTHTATMTHHKKEGKKHSWSHGNKCKKKALWNILVWSAFSHLITHFSVTQKAHCS